MTLPYAIILFFVYAFFILYLLASGDILKFISPRIVWLSYLSGIFLALFIIVLSSEEIKLKKEGKNLKSLGKLFFLLYPIFVYFLFQPSELKNLPTPTVKIFPKEKSSKGYEALKSLPISEDGYVRLNLFELWILAKNNPHLTQRYRFITEGEISMVEKGVFGIRRYFMTCCVADATAVEVEVLKKDEFNFAKGDWVRIGGKVFLKDYVLIIPDFVERIKKPTQVYITRWSEEPPFNP